MNMICIEMSHFYGMPVTGSALSGDAKASNLQAGAEGMMTGLACVMAGADSMLAFGGLIDGAETVSLAKIMLDRDVVGMIERFVRDDPIDATTALIDDIVDVGIGGHFLGRKSTRRFFREGELWQPTIFQREPFDSYHGTTLVAQAAAKAREIVAGHDVTPLDDDVQRHITQVIADYRKVVAG